MSENIKNSEFTLSGYVVDIACLRKYGRSALVDKVRIHSKSCLLMGHCIESGYALVDSKSQITLLEPEITLPVIQAVTNVPQEQGIRLKVTFQKDGAKARASKVEALRSSGAYPPRKRTPEEVLNDHLQKSQHGDIDSDLEENFSPNVQILTSAGVFRGFSGMRRLAQLLSQQLPNSRFTYESVVVAEKVAFLRWTAESPKAVVRDGADSYVFGEDGKIAAQTISYSVISKSPDYQPAKDGLRPQPSKPDESSRTTHS